jgi:hypothetical protein
MINKNKWVLIWNGENGEAITFKQNIGLCECYYNLIDLRRINKESQNQNLSVYFSGKKTKQFIFNNREEALKYLFKEYPFLIEFKENIKE